MGIGRIASLLGSLNPTATPAAEQAPLDTGGRADVAVAESGSMDSDRHQGDGRSGMAAQIQQLLSSIEKLHEAASADGAAMAFSHSGASLRDAVGGLGHLLATARDTRALLPPELVKEAGDVMNQVEGGLPQLRTAVQQRMDQMDPVAAFRVADTSNRFVAELQAAVNQVRGALGVFR